MSSAIVFFVAGHPQTKGSAKAFMPKGARFPVVTHDNPKTKDWQVQIAAVAGEKFSAPFATAVRVTALFQLRRPKSLPKKVLHHTKKPDLDKLFRAVKDGLKGIAYLDDSQVSALSGQKVYAFEGMAVGVLVTVEPLSSVGVTEGA